MKILQFITTLGTGGAEAVVRDYCIELKRRGHDVEVLILFPFVNSMNEKILEEEGIRVISIYENIFFIKKANVFFLKLIRKPFRNYKVRKWIKNYLEKERPDVLHCHLENLRFIPDGVCASNGIKLFHTCHNEANYYFGSTKNIDFKPAKKLLEKDNLSFFSLTKRMKKDLEEIFPDSNVEVMNNPVDFSKFNNLQKSKYILKNELGLSNEDFIIGHVGRFVEQKNHDFLIDVFYEVQKIKKNAKLLLIGEGPLLTNIKEKCLELKISNKVVFTGVRQDVPELMSLMDVFLFPSKFEGLGIVVIEAQFIVPEIFVSNPVPEDVVVTNKVRYLDINEKPEVWASEIISKKNAPRKPSSTLNDFDIKQVIDRLEKFYEKK